MKKLLAALMALLMVALPVLGLAEGGSFLEEAAANGRAIESVTTFAAGEDLTGQEAVDQIINDVLAAMSITYYWQEQDGAQAGLRFAMQGQEVLTADFAGKDGEVYLTSDLLAGTTLAMKPDESEAVVDKLLDLMVRQGLIDQRTADEARAEFKASLEAAAEGNATDTVDYEKMMEGFINNADSLTGFVEWVVGLAERVEDADVSGQPANSDPATTAKRLTISAEDIITAWELMIDPLKANEEYMKLLDQTVQQSDGQFENGAALLDAVLETLRAELPGMMKDDAVLTVYLADDGLVAMTIEMAFEDGADTIAVKADYTRLMAEDGVATHAFRWDVTATENGKTTHSVTDLSIAVQDNSFDAILALTDDETAMTFTLQANWTEADTERTAKAVLGWVVTGTEADGTGHIDMDFNEKKTGANDAEQTVVLDLTVNDKYLLTVTNTSKTVDPYENIVNGDVLRPAQMTDAELDAWYDDVAGNIQIWLFKLIQALPTSVLMLLMSMGA